VQTIKFVDLARYQYILTNNKTKFGDFHALMPALFGKAAQDPDAYLKNLKNEPKELPGYAIPSPMAKVLVCSPGLQSRDAGGGDGRGLKKHQAVNRRRNFRHRVGESAGNVPAHQHAPPQHQRYEGRADH
jgi:hypothetical protein